MSSRRRSIHGSVVLFCIGVAVTGTRYWAAIRRALAEALVGLDEPTPSCASSKTRVSHVVGCGGGRLFFLASMSAALLRKAHPMPLPSSLTESIDADAMTTRVLSV